VKRTIRLLAMAGLAGAVIWFERVRRSGELAGLVTRRFNPLVMRFGLAGGRRSPWAILEHVGRTSGTTYHTPISLVGAGHHVYVRLSYGAGVHWVTNVRSAGHCRIQLHEELLELDEPAVVPASENPLVPPMLRTALDRGGRTYMRLHVLDRAPGTFVHHAAAEASGTPPAVPSIEIVHPDPTPVA
jgi:deazaflavin-dependent oxidoreductase (nitroreductase family)